MAALETCEVILIDRGERLDLVSRLDNIAAVHAGAEELKFQRDTYYQNLARNLSSSTAPVDQRDIDYKRGFWQGAIWALTRFPKKARVDLEREIEQAMSKKDGELSE